MRVVMALSGGMDSAALLYHLRSLGHEVVALSFDYGQRHARELHAARVIADRLGVDHQVVDLTGLRPLLGGSALTDRSIDVPEGHYEDPVMRATVVPNRNMIMISVLIGRAISLDFDAVAFGAHHGDRAIYPDCRVEFGDAIDAAAALCHDKPIKVLRPFVELHKGEVAKRGGQLDVPWHLTWTCYKGGDHHCGVCGACQERREAFAFAGIDDQTHYLDLVNA